MIYTNGEQKENIVQVSEKINIILPGKRYIERIAGEFDVGILYNPAVSFFFKMNNMYIISLDNRKNHSDQWADFIRNLCRILQKK
ncbi:hypothetical protein [Bacillus sonorensis]|uniref:hypothetical protein n=1 Tax=Bacillus sonorensis TaxID=119858 RepID=UPI00098B24E1|nr:hypothetical protein [Bacillus sonorensis]